MSAWVLLPAPEALTAAVGAFYHGEKMGARRAVA